MTNTGEYTLPVGQLSLSGPVARPEPGTLPLRGDIAHIALANRYLVAAYVIPIPRKIGAAGAQLLLTPSDTAEVVTTLEPGARFEALDYAGDWCWGCCGPEGPSGYLPIAQLA